MVFSIGVFSGTLFQYNNSTTPSLIASESLLTLWYHIWRPPSMLLNLKQQQHTSTTKEKCICNTYVGLSDRPITTPYTKLLEEECRSLVWSPCPVNTREVSSLAGRVHTWAFLVTDRFANLLDYLVVHHYAEYFVSWPSRRGVKIRFILEVLWWQW